MYVVRRVHATIFCSGKAISIAYLKCLFVALNIHHAIRMRHIVICGLSGYFLRYHKRHDFRKIIEDKNVYFDFLYNFV